MPRIQYKNIPEVEYDNIWELAKNVLLMSKEENNSNDLEDKAKNYVIK